ncbi:MAG: hypothetical protein PVH45_01575, partial [Candidatus Omnitrophota bacterium]
MLVVCLFTLNSISWANPDLLTNKAERSCLNVHSGFNLAANPRLYHEMHVKLFAQAILESVKKENFKHFKKRIPIFGTDGKGKSENNLNIVLDYSNKKKDETGRNWLIQCDVFDDEKTYFWKYYVVVDIESGTISLRERNGSERMKYSWTSHTGLKIDIVGFDEKTFKRYWHNIRYIFWEESIIRRIRTSRGFVTKGPKLVKYDFRNLERVIIYSAADKAYKEFGGEVKLSQAKNSLFIPVRSPECIYTDIAKALWHVVDPERIESNVKGWNGEIRGLLKAHEPQMIERIERCISWDWQNMDPDYLYAARSMWLKLEEPIVINGTMFRYVKLKGTTYKGIYPPSSELFKDGASKGLIADENGRVKSIDLTCISGTMEAGRAENEFNVTNDAFNRDITRSYAVAYGSYPRIGLNRLEGGRL